jgi:hypothetical protein
VENIFQILLLIASLAVRLIPLSQNLIDLYNKALAGTPPTDVEMAIAKAQTALLISDMDAAVAAQQAKSADVAFDALKASVAEGLEQPVAPVEVVPAVPAADGATPAADPVV